MLLQQGAHVVVSATDFACELDLLDVGRRTEGRTEVSGRTVEPRRLAPVARRVWGVLGEQPVGIEKLARLARLDAGRVLAALTELEVAGWVAQEAGMRFRRAS